MDIRGFGWRPSICSLMPVKLFDKINFWLLFQKLFDNGFPTLIITILAFWYTHQEMHI